MRSARRRFLRLAAGASALPIVLRGARAQTWPARPVRMIVGLAPGSAPDIGARLLGQWLSERLGQAFVVENRPGANTNIATEAALRAAPDGHTLLLALAANAVNATLYHNLSFDFRRDAEPVGGFVLVPHVLEVHPSVPVKTVPEFIAYAKANPGKLNMASAGIGGTPHVAGELFKMMAGVDMLHVPYRGSPRPDLVAGQMQVMFDTLPASIGFIRSGQLRPLAVTTAQRVDVLPDVPTVAEFLPGYEATGWQGIVAPKGTPAEIVARLDQEIRAALADAKVKAQLAKLGATPMPMSSAQFGKLIADEIGKWAKVITFAHIKVE